MSDEVGDEKRAMRAEIRERRRLLTPAQLEAAADGVSDQLGMLVKANGATSMSCYLSAPTEPGTRAFVNGGLEHGLRILLPISREDGLLDWTAAELDGGEIETAFGVPEAVGEVLGPIAVNDVDLMIVPASAVDEEGFRMGWGRGYYDKTLGSMLHSPPVYAVIYDSELVERVPREIHDQSVDGVVTPTRTITFAR